MSLQSTPHRKQADEFYEKIGKQLEALRKSEGLTQQQLADILHLTRVSVTNIEAGKQRLSVFDYFKLCQKFDLTMDELLNKEFEPLQKVGYLSKKDKFEKYRLEVLASGMTTEQLQGAETVFIGLRDLLGFTP